METNGEKKDVKVVNQADANATKRDKETADTRLCADVYNPDRPCTDGKTEKETVDTRFCPDVPRPCKDTA